VIAVVDYGASNLRSVMRALRAAGADAGATASPDEVRRAERVVLPGVGHFAPARRRLEAAGLDEAVLEAARGGRPVLGICLGLQLFLHESEEAPGLAGLGLLPGAVAEFRTELPVPHVGWARVRATPAGRCHPVLVAALDCGEGFFYHVHSYHPARVPEPAALAEAEYGASFATIVGRDNVLGVQFHPEKSQTAGLALLRAFAEWRP
jgi:imidazole glycerol phosphate synthase glutamine amidotransferase subunit